MKFFRSFIRVVLLGFVALTAHAALAVDYWVSGAPAVEFNGVYVENGTSSSRPKYERSANGSVYEIRYDMMSGWMILKDSVTFYINMNDPGSPVPPFLYWEESGAGGRKAPTLQVETATEKLRFDTTELVEAEANNGTIGNSITITHNNFNGTTFSGSDGDDFIQTGLVTASNVPAGLTAELTRIDQRTLRLELTGSATNSAHANDISNLTLTFSNAAFSSNDASAVENNSISSLKVNFRDLFTVGPSGRDFTTISAAIAAVNRYDILVLDAATFTEKNITINKEIVIRGQGADQTIIQAMVTPESETGRIFSINGGLKFVAIQIGRAHV